MDSGLSKQNARGLEISRAVYNGGHNYHTEKIPIEHIQRMDREEELRAYILGHYYIDPTTLIKNYDEVSKHTRVTLFMIITLQFEGYIWKEIADALEILPHTEKKSRPELKLTKLASKFFLPSFYILRDDVNKQRLRRELLEPADEEEEALLKALERELSMNREVFLNLRCKISEASIFTRKQILCARLLILKNNSWQLTFKSLSARYPDFTIPYSYSDAANLSHAISRVFTKNFT